MKLISYRIWILCAALVVAAASSVIPVRAAERVALVIGNNQYEHFPQLSNPVNDARAVAAALRQAGFTRIILKEDVNASALYEAVEEFKAGADSAEIGLVYFAGHGIEVEGKNYLLAVDARLESAGQMRRETLPLDVILDDLRETKLAAKLVILDCCRDNPIQRPWLSTRGTGSGLSEVKEAMIPAATMIMYSAGPGQKAADGEGANNPFTAALVARMQEPGLTLFDAFLCTSDDVREATNKKQEPWVKFDGAGRSFRDLVFVVPGPAPGAALAEESMIVATGSPEAQAKFWKQLKLAHTGNAAAQNQVGEYFANGNGVVLNYEEGVKWFRLSAEQGYVKGQCNLGLMYDLGYGVKESKVEAAKWLRLAAAQGDSFAKHSRHQPT